MMNRLVSLICFLCATWVLCYMIFAGNDPGRSFYAHMAGNVMGDSKGGGMILHLAFPILFAGTLASLFWTLPSLSFSRRGSATLRQRLIPNWLHRCRHRLIFVEGDWNLNVWAWTLIAVPSVIFISMTIRRHMHGKELSLDDQIMVTSNSFGVVAEVVGSFLLIPVARHSSLLKVAGWSPARAVQLHVWTGRIFILAVIVHGVMHVFRWIGLAKESLLGMLIPPADCWSMDSDTYNAAQPVCVDDDTDCTCYDIHRNLTGFLGGVTLLVLLITSLHQVRRSCYKLFYISHVIAAPLAIILVVLHWNRSVLFLAPSLIYYTASSVPVFVERWLQQWKSNGSVEVVSIVRIPSLSAGKTKQDNNTSTTHYISLTVRATEAAVRQFRPGYYVQLLAPDVSSVAHPFTINLVPGKHDQLRIIFKVMRNFTKQLSHRLQQAQTQAPQQQPPTSVPPIFLNGYLGTPNRVGEVLKHDVAVMIAGGIGITPYLTLIHHVNDLLTQAPPNTFATKRIVLLWICRDADLVDYVKREYFEPLLTANHHNQNKHSSDFKIKLVIYQTGDATTALPYTDDEENALPVDPTVLAPSKAEESLSPGLAFSPSRFATGSTASIKSNVLCFLAFSCTSWLGLASVWWVYKHLQAKHALEHRITGLVILAVIGLVVAVIANMLSCISAPQSGGGQRNASNGLWSPVPSFEEGDARPAGLTRSSSIEMENVVHAPDLSERSASQDEDDDGGVVVAPTTSNVVCMEEKRGRPTVHQMLKFVDNARHPGLFTCGPLPLMKNIREHTEERCLLRLQQCMRGASHHISLYEEAFAM